MSNLDEIFIEIKKIIEAKSKGLFSTNNYIGSKAKERKPGYHIYGNKDVSLFGKKPQKTYIAGVIKQKNYVSLYFSPIYSHPDDFNDISEELKKFLKGKSCFNINKTTSGLYEEINDLLARGIEKYKEIGWI